MGYNPYICIICHDCEDNGWFYQDDFEGDYFDRCEYICKVLKLDFDKTIQQFREQSYEDGTPDVCFKCILKKPPVKS